MEMVLVFLTVTTIVVLTRLQTALMRVWGGSWGCSAQRQIEVCKELTRARFLGLPMATLRLTLRRLADFFLARKSGQPPVDVIVHAASVGERARQHTDVTVWIRHPYSKLHNT